MNTINSILYIIIIFVCCKATGSFVYDSSEENLRLTVRVNNEVIFGTGIVKYNVGDNIFFSCRAEHGLVSNIKLIIDRSNIRLAPNNNMKYVTYTITADDFDNDSEVYCIAEMWNSTTRLWLPIQSAPKKLKLNAGVKSKSSLPEVVYHDGSKLNYTCKGTDNKDLSTIHKIINDIHNIIPPENIVLTPSDTGTLLYCEIIQYHGTYLNSEGYESLNYTRKIYKKTVYLYTSPVTNEIKDKDKPASNLSAQIGIGVGVLACVALAASCLLLRYRRKKKRLVDVTPPSTQDLCTEPNQLIYAELELPDRPSTTSVPQDRNDPTYAQIVGFIPRKIKQ